MKVVCNLKAHKTWKEYREYIADLNKLDTNHELIVAPSFPYLAYYPKNIALCAAIFERNFATLSQIPPCRRAASGRCTPRRVTRLAVGWRF